MIKGALIIGATSAIAEECSRQLISKTKSIFLFGRNKNKLEKIANDLEVRGINKVSYDTFDAEKHSSQAKNMIDNVHANIQGFDTAIFSHGLMLDQEDCEKSINQTKNILDINLLSMVSYLIAVSQYFIKRGHGGKIIVISSVAGDRARISNYIYGASKAALSFFCDGMNQKLQQHNINILVVKPGFIDTPMTANIKNKGFLWSTPEKVAKDIIKNISKRKRILYTPWFWKIIMIIIKLIPRKLLIKLGL